MATSPVEKMGELFMSARYSMKPEDRVIQQSVTCPFCTSKTLLKSFSNLQEGSHICFGGDKLKKNILKKQYALYYHHAIVEEVKVLSPFSAQLTLIQFSSTSFDSVNRIRRNCEERSLSKDEIYVVHYRQPIHTPEKIIERARKLLANSDKVVYSGLERNCEHLCNLCCAGSDVSLQVDKGFAILLQEVFSSFGSIGRMVMRVLLGLFYSSTDNFTQLSGVSVSAPWGELSSLVIIQLIYCAYQHIQYNKRLKAGTMCYSCCKQKKTDMWLRFGAFCLLQVGGLKMFSMVATVVASKGILLGLMSIYTIMALGLIWNIPKIKMSLCSPFQGMEIEIHKIDQIWPGDVIKIRKKKDTIYGVVSYVKAYKPDKRRGRIKIIHYNKPGMLQKRTVIEFEDYYDLKKVRIRQLDYSMYNCHDAESVIRRARKRVGEKKYGLLTNRNCHFCHWAKVIEEDANLDQSSVSQIGKVVQRSLSFGSSIKVPSLYIDNSPGRPHATETVSKRWARIRDEVKAGQVIGLGVLRNKAVCTQVTYSESAKSRLSVNIVHYGHNYKVCEETIEVDLNEEDIWIYPYNPLFCFSGVDVVRRARERIGRGGYNLFTHRSSHLAAEIVERGIDEQVHSIGMLKHGDVIKFDYWGFQHEAVVSKVLPEESKEALSQEPLSGEITVIHYALPSLLSKRTIIEEPFRFNLTDQVIYLKRYDGYVTYSREKVVQRAQSRKGEQRFSVLSNTSSTFVHWAKVIQTPVLVAMATPGIKQDQSQKDLAALMPLVGKQYKNFRTVQVYSWEELKPGSIISYSSNCFTYQEGILSEVDENEKRIKWIHYETSMFAATEIVEETLLFDPRYAQLWLYQCDPRICKKTGEILRCARRRLGEKNWEFGISSWDFCLDCVLKKRSRSTSRTR